jgi:hypothetical protein
VACNISGDVGGRPDVTNAGSLLVAGALWLCGCEREPVAAAERLWLRSRPRSCVWSTALIKAVARKKIRGGIWRRRREDRGAVGAKGVGKKIFCQNFGGGLNP